MKLAREDRKYYREYKKQFAHLPFPPIFVTVDAVVQDVSGRVLVIQRKRTPGKGLYALPGGFVNANETIKNALWRELREETGIRKNRVIVELGYEVFDNPKRSRRGRVITHAFRVYCLTLPKLKAGDDAATAKFLYLDEIKALKNKFFEDHYDIIFNCVPEP